MRGFYESEGSVSKHMTGNLRIRMANKCVELLKMVRDILAGWGIDSRLYGPDDNDCFTLSVYGTERVNRFLSMVKPCIKTRPRQLPKICSDLLKAVKRMIASFAVAIKAT